MPLLQSRRELATRWVGRKLSDRYVLERVIGLGGMGAVFAGRHVDLDRPVAIKTVLPGMVLARGGERLLREAREAARVGGRGVVDVLDVAVDDLVGPYLVMELLEGETLAAHLSANAPLTTQRALTLLGPLLKTLALLHDADLIHRDLKPQNLLLAEEDGEVVMKLLDFGLARRGAEPGSVSVTESGAVVGTPRYMAPEQARGEPVDHRADLYAMGAILYFALGGRKPYDGFTASEEVIELVLAGGPPPLSQVAGGVSEAVVALVSRAMSADPEERFVNAGAMLAALEAAAVETDTPFSQDVSSTLSAERLSHHPFRHEPMGRRWPKRLGIVGLVALLVGGSWALFQGLTSGPDASVTQTLEPGPRAPEREPDAPVSENPPLQNVPIQNAPIQNAPIQNAPIQNTQESPLRRVVDRRPRPRPSESEHALEREQAPEYEGRSGVFRVDDF